MIATRKWAKSADIMSGRLEIRCIIKIFDRKYWGGGRKKNKIFDWAEKYVMRHNQSSQIAQLLVAVVKLSEIKGYQLRYPLLLLTVRQPTPSENSSEGDI